jgi:hypothetical protein
MVTPGSSVGGLQSVYSRYPRSAGVRSEPSSHVSIASLELHPEVCQGGLIEQEFARHADTRPTARTAARLTMPLSPATIDTFR